MRNTDPGATFTDGYIHHLPGRLRVRSSLVRRNDQAARAAEAWLRLLPGVSSVEANTLTGSLMVRYDPAQTKGCAIVSELKQAGWIGSETQMPTPRPREMNIASTSDIASQIAGKIAFYTLEKAAEISVRALVSAIP